MKEFNMPFSVFRSPLGIAGLFLVIILSFAACPTPNSGKTKIAKPDLVKNQFTFTGSPHTVELTAEDAAYTLGGDVTQTNVGTYTATVTLKSTASYEWADGTTAPLSLSWSIDEGGPVYLPVDYDDLESIFGGSQDDGGINPDGSYYQWDDPDAFDFFLWFEQHGYILYDAFDTGNTSNDLKITLYFDVYGEGIHKMWVSHYANGVVTFYNFINYCKIVELFEGTGYVESVTVEKVFDIFTNISYLKWTGNQTASADERLESLGWSKLPTPYTATHSEFEDWYFALSKDHATYIMFYYFGFMVVYVAGEDDITMYGYTHPNLD